MLRQLPDCCTEMAYFQPAARFYSSAVKAMEERNFPMTWDHNQLQHRDHLLRGTSRRNFLV